ncbi:MAG TPA: helix-turn-helix transcriptional regulator [Ktedonobacteraceae bacterium]|nr:helix-turn-helix transcriptional regulator [Ktedonobacteraceae bacterium]
MRLRIKEVAEERGFNMSSLSRASDVSFRTIKRLWKDPTQSANTYTLERIARALNVRVADLIEESF